MTDTRTAQAPLAIPSLVVGALGVLSLVLIRIPAQAAPALILGIVAAILGHLALRTAAGTRRKIALAGLVAGYVSVGGAIIAVAMIAIF